VKLELGHSPIRHDVNEAFRKIRCDYTQHSKLSPPVYPRRAMTIQQIAEADMADVRQGFGWIRAMARMGKQDAHPGE